MKRYSNPAHFKTALEQRIRNQTSATGGRVERLRQFIVYDRFVARLRTVFGDGFILKGGFVLELRLASARTTRDVDLTLYGDPRALLRRLQEAGRLDLDDFFTFEVSGHPRGVAMGSPELPYLGERYRCACQLAGRPYGDPFGLDIAFASPCAPPVEEIAGSDLLSFLGIAPVAYRVISREAHIAEKLHAYSYPRPPTSTNARLKDLPDIALLATTAGLRAARIRAAVAFTFARRASHAVPSALGEPPVEWAARYPAMAADNRLPWSTLDDVLAAARAFVDPILASNDDAEWDPDAWAWRALA